jgi:hypothetical protein
MLLILVNYLKKDNNSNKGGGKVNKSFLDPYFLIGLIIKKLNVCKRIGKNILKWGLNLVDVEKRIFLLITVYLIHNLLCGFQQAYYCPEYSFCFINTMSCFIFSFFSTSSLIFS